MNAGTYLLIRCQRDEVRELVDSTDCPPDRHDSLVIFLMRCDFELAVAKERIEIERAIKGRRKQT